MIATQAEIDRLISILDSVPWVALDTEADSLHAYPEKLCLLQMSLPDCDELVDPLAGLDLRPLLEILRGRELILHGADYDLRLLHRSFHFVPGTIFDTMWAARLLGHREFGLGHLTAHYLNVALEKGPQKMNWARRPLTERMERYAHNDTRYLKELAELLRTKLGETGRLAWHQEICQRVIEDCTQPKTRGLDSWRVKGSDRLDRLGLAILHQLWRWREHEALAANKPPYFVLSHEKLVALAEHLSRSKLRHPAILPHLPAQRAARLEAAIKRAFNLPSDRFPQIRRGRPRHLTHSQSQQFEELRTRRDRHAAALGLDPTLIASRAELLALAKGADPAKLLLRWQHALLTA